MTAARLDHVGILVEDFRDVQALFGTINGARLVGPESERATAMEVLWVEVGDVKLQFIRPTRDDTGAAQALREHGPGVHHVGLEVDDVTAVLGQLRAQGVETRDQVSRPGARGARVGFIDPRALAGVELELVERAS
jgi:methylmalonyl-CoA/ethylmalonyl-CoA epimerase